MQSEYNYLILDLMPPLQGRLGGVDNKEVKNNSKEKPGIVQ